MNTTFINGRRFLSILKDAIVVLKSKIIPNKIIELTNQ